VSARGGFIQLVAFQGDAMHKATVEGLDNADPPAPGLVRINKDGPNVFKKLTSMNLQVFCDECRPMQGMVVVDNMVFEK
jgi:hypothetical protein